jgi:hypothetical protein
MCTTARLFNLQQYCTLLYYIVLVLWIYMKGKVNQCLGWRNTIRAFNKVQIKFSQPSKQLQKKKKKENLTLKRSRFIA